MKGITSLKPVDIDGLFFDSADYHGLLFWYDDIAKQVKEAKDKKQQSNW